MRLHRADQPTQANRLDRASSHAEVNGPVRDVYGRTLDEAREADQRDYVARKSRVDGLGAGQARIVWLCCWVLAATIPVSFVSPEWMQVWWPLAVIGICVGIFGLVAAMRWLLATVAGCLGVEPPKPPDQRTLGELHAGSRRDAGPGSGSAA